MLCYFGALCQFPGSSQEGLSNPPGGLQQTNFADTLEREPFTYTAYDLHNLRSPSGLIDTLIDDLHKLEPYYQGAPLGGNLGSEYSSSFNFFYDYKPSPLSLGQTGHDLLLSDPRSRTLFLPNRDFFEAVYNSSWPISGNQFKLSYYKPFARQIYLNFNYNSYTDGGAISAQEENFKQLNLKLYQKSKLGKRITYIHYDNPRISEAIARSDDTNEGATIFNQRRKIEIGNSLLLGDSVTVAKQNKRIDSRLIFAKEGYSLNDGGIADSELGLYQLGTGSTGFIYLNQIKKINLRNSYRQATVNGFVEIGLDLGTASTKADSIKLNNYKTIQLFGNHKMTIGSKGKLMSSLKVGFGDIAGDLRSKVNYASRYKAIVYNLGLSYDLISPTISRRQLYLNELVVSDYGLNNTRRLEAEASLHIPRLGFKAHATYQQYQDLILPDLLLGWKQIDQSINIAQLTLEKEFNLGFLKTKHFLYLQQISDNELLPRPKLQYRGNLYFNLKLFKRRMSTRWGVDTYFIPSYQAPDFQPLWGEWYENRTPYNSDNIVIVNPYLNIQVDRLFFFVKGINVARQFLPQEPSWGGAYPIYNYRVRFGLRWTLLD